MWRRGSRPDSVFGPARAAGPAAALLSRGAADFPPFPEALPLPPSVTGCNDARTDPHAIRFLVSGAGHARVNGVYTDTGDVSCGGRVFERCLGSLRVSLMRFRMREGGFNLGGEQSGHIILSDFSTTGDGLLAALQVLAVLKESDRPMSALARQFDPVPQKLENVRFAGGKPLDSDEVKAVMAEAELKLNGSGRILVRASGTEPLIRIMAEGDDEKLVSQVVREIAGAVKRAAA